MTSLKSTWKQGLCVIHQQAGGGSMHAESGATQQVPLDAGARHMHSKNEAPRGPYDSMGNNAEERVAILTAIQTAWIHMDSRWFSRANTRVHLACYISDFQGAALSGMER